MNLPNKISLIRIISIPIMVFFYLASFVPYGKAVALVIFTVAALTDFLDGAIARKRNLVTDLGKFLDPIADKTLMSCALFLILADGTMAAPWGVIMTIIIITREFIVTALRQIAATKQTVIAADMWGKVKANFQPIAIAFFMFIAIDNQYSFLGVTRDYFLWASYILMGIATVLTIISGINYVVKNIKVFASTPKEETSNTQSKEE